MEIKLTVVTPSYNRAGYLPRLWNSLSDQGMEFEWLVVDDCGQDNTRDVLAELGDRRIRYLRLEQNLGTSGARNAGIANARGEYLIFIDDDDEFLPGVLSKMVDYIENAPDDVAVVGFPEVAGDTGKVVARVTDGGIYDEQAIVCTDALNGAMNFIYRTGAIRGTPFDEKLRTMGDLVWLKALSKKHRIMTRSLPTVRYNRHPDSVMGSDSMVRNSKLIALSHETILENHALTLSRCPTTTTYHLQAALYRYGVARNREKAWHTYVRLLKHSMAPKNVMKSTGLLIIGMLGLGPVVDRRRTKKLMEQFGH